MEKTCGLGKIRIVYKMPIVPRSQLFLSIIDNVSDFVINRFFIVFKCYISTIKDHTDIVWNQLFQAINGICLICEHTMYMYMYIYNRLLMKCSGKVLWKSGKSRGTFKNLLSGNPVYVGTLCMC